MAGTPLSEVEDRTGDPGLKELAVQLADDATAFVVAETSYLKAELGEIGRGHV